MVLLHGLFANPAQMLFVKRQLRTAGFDVHSLHYPTVLRPLASNVDRLCQKIADRDLRDAHVVAHSLGGIMAVHLQHRCGQRLSNRMVFAGSPLAGSGVADRFSRWPVVGRLINNSLRNGLDGDLPSLDPATNYQVGMIAGTNASFGVGRIVGGLEGQNDGVVELTETEHPVVSERVTVDKTHITMLFSKSTAELMVTFLRTGRF